jgi:Na+/proline symporter
LSELPSPLPLKKYGLVALGLALLNLVVYTIYGSTRTDVWLSVLTFTLIYAVIWGSIKILDTEKLFRKINAKTPGQFALTTLMEIVFLIAAIYVYYFFSLGQREPLSVFKSFLASKASQSPFMKLVFVLMILLFLGFLAFEFIRPEEKEEQEASKKK